MLIIIIISYIWCI